MGEFLKVMELKYSLSRQLTNCKANIMNVPKTGSGTTCLN